MGHGRLQQDKQKASNAQGSQQALRSLRECKGVLLDPWEAKKQMQHGVLLAFSHPKHSNIHWRLALLINPETMLGMFKSTPAQGLLMAKLTPADDNA